MEIRTMQRSDLTQVAKLAGQLGYPCGAPAMEKRFSFLDNNAEHALIVACDDEKILGWIHMYQEPRSLLGEPRADIGALVVDESARSQGIGRALITAGEKWANDNKLSLIRVRSNTKRLDAHRFYLREGYKIEKSWHLFTKSMDQ